MSYWTDLDDIVRNYGVYASTDDIAAWTVIDYGDTANSYDNVFYFGGSGQDLMASYDDGGIYYTCLYAEDYGNDYWCDYYRIATLYDGWTVNQGTNIYTPFDDLDAMTNPIDNGDELYHCNAYTFMCIYTSFDSYYVLATTTNYYYVYNYSLYIQFADYVSDSDWYATWGDLFEYNYWFAGMNYSSMAMDSEYDYTYGTIGTRFVPVWQSGYSIGDTVSFLNSAYITAYEFTTNDITIAGASTLLASAATALAIASVL